MKQQARASPGCARVRPRSPRTRLAPSRPRPPRAPPPPSAAAPPWLGCLARLLRRRGRRRARRAARRWRPVRRVGLDPRRLGRRERLLELGEVRRHRLRVGLGRRRGLGRGEAQARVVPRGDAARRARLEPRGVGVPREALAALAAAAHRDRERRERVRPGLRERRRALGLLLLELAGQRRDRAERDLARRPELAGICSVLSKTLSAEAPPCARARRRPSRAAAAAGARCGSRLGPARSGCRPAPRARRRPRRATAGGAGPRRTTRRRLACTARPARWRPTRAPALAPGGGRGSWRVRLRREPRARARRRRPCSSEKVVARRARRVPPERAPVRGGAEARSHRGSAMRDGRSDRHSGPQSNKDPCAFQHTLDFWPGDPESTLPVL